MRFFLVVLALIPLLSCSAEVRPKNTCPSATTISSWSNLEGDYFEGMTEFSLRASAVAIAARCVTDDLGMIGRENLYKTKIEDGLATDVGYTIVEPNNADVFAVFKIQAQSIDNKLSPDLCFAEYELKLGLVVDAEPPWSADSQPGFLEIAHIKSSTTTTPDCTADFFEKSADEAAAYLNWLPKQEEANFQTSPREAD